MSKKILLIDNYDSFTYNLAHAFEALGVEVVVRRNDLITLDEAIEFDRIVLSPGPGLPSEAGIMPELISSLAGNRPLLGICLGCQGMAEFYGAELFRVNPIIHGQPTTLRWDMNARLTKEAKILPAEGGLYHSWAIKSDSLPNALKPVASDERNILMAWEHVDEPSWGIQFHPESILTPNGRELLEVWLKIS